MANNYRKIDKDELIKLAYEFVDECIDGKREMLSNSGKVVKLGDRKVATIEYFCNHWIRRKDFDFYCRQHFYDALNNEVHPLSDTLKKIRGIFDSLAVDIVANEGKAIFYAKNRLGMTDKTDNTNRNIEQPFFGDD